jgi:hypothetical protein
VLGEVQALALPQAALPSVLLLRPALQPHL